MVKVILKKSSVASKIPLVADLQYGELALNYQDEKLYYKNASNVIKSLDLTVSTSGGTGTVTSVALSVPTGLTVTGSPVTTSGTIAIALQSNYSIPATSSQTNWDTAYTDRNKWDGGSTGLIAATGRTSLGATTVGSGLFTLANPSAISFLRVNADNTISSLDAATFRTAIGAGTSSATTIQSITTATTITPTPATCTQYEVTALATPTTIAIPAGSPADGQKLILRIKDNGTAQALTWTATSGAYRAIGCALPSSTIVSKVVYIGLIYNSQDSFWDAVSVAQL